MKGATSEESQLLEDEQVQVSAYNLGIGLVKFAQRIDPIMHLFRQIEAIVLWKNAQLTMMLGVAVSLGIYYLEVLVLVGGLSFYFCEGVVMRKLERIHRYDRVRERILFPEENAAFLLNLINWYSDNFDSFCQVLFNHDKTLLLNIVKLGSKLSLATTFILILFHSRTLLILAIWALLIWTSSLKPTLVLYIKPLILQLLE